MAMTMIEITQEQAVVRIKALLAARESRTLDFKHVSGKMVGKALETICAFAEFARTYTTFPLADKAVKVAALNAYRDVERGLVN